jgi:ABC-type multidrug transport system fused ATPase/permease subunit
MYGHQSGQILLDDVPLHEWNKQHFFENVVTVPQDSILFARTIEENIKFGLEATRKEVIAAARKANCHEFIEKMERGYMSVVGERGTNLSGGQKQRISIARAMLRNPKILLLDEATSSLDTKSERCVQSALHDVMKNNNGEMSIVVIAHRLSTIRKANRIVVFDNGARIIEVGDHDHLMKLTGHYAELVNQQKLTDLDEEEEEGESTKEQEKGRCASPVPPSTAPPLVETTKHPTTAAPAETKEKLEQQKQDEEELSSDTNPAEFSISCPAMEPQVTG